MRRQGYHYWRAALRHHLSLAAALRIDHVMGLHRLYWIPDGMDARQGVYVRYPSEEMYAVLCIESHRQRALIVGEDLGTVPRAVTRGMARRGVHRTYVLQYEASPQGVPDPPERSVASLNTHDMAPFASFWQGLDILDQAALGLHTPEGVTALRRRLAAVKRALLRRLRRGGWLPASAADTNDVLLACLRMLAASDARAVSVNLEDLWGETQPQNVPGTTHERPNWRRRARYAMEDMMGMEAVGLALGEVQRLRKAQGAGA
jgi:4-alpha-glucanotransferase